MPTARIRFFVLSLLALGVSARAAPADALSAAAAATGVARIRHAPDVSGTIQGSVQMMLAEDFRLQGNATLSCDLRVPGSPTVTLQATAVDRDGSVARVEFFGNGKRLGTATTAPYQLALTQLAAGPHTFVARAWDNRGASQDSVPAVVSVVGNRPPAVAITSPVDGAVFIASATFPVTAAASDPDGSIARVEFWRDDSKIADNFFAPFATAVRGLPAGTFTLRARAFDNLGQWSDSPPVSVVVAVPNRPPEVALLPDRFSSPALKRQNAFPP